MASSPWSRELARLLAFALPATLVVALSGVFLIVDTYFVARLGPDVLLGVSLVFPLYLLLVMFFGGGLGVGFSVVTSVRLGQGDEEGARRAAGSTVALALVSAGVLGGLALLTGPSLFARLATSPEAARAAWRFGAPLFAGMPFIAASLTLTNLLRGEKRLGAAAAMMITGGIVNTVLNPVLIHGLGGLPALGERGAGLATVLGFGVSSGLGLVLLRGQRRLALRWHHLRLSWRELEVQLRISLPTLLMYAVNNAVLLVLLMRFSSRSAEAGVAYGLATRLEYLLVLTLYGLGGALMTLAGEARGAGRHEEAHRLFRLAGLAALVGTTPFAAVLWLWPEAWFRLFEASPSAVELGARYARCVAWAYPPYALALTLNYAYQTLGRAHTGLGLTFLRGVGFALPGVWLAAHLTGSVGAMSEVIAASFALQGVAAWALLGHMRHVERPSSPPGEGEERDLETVKLPSWRVSPYPLGYSVRWPYYFRVPSMRNHTHLPLAPLQARWSTGAQPTVRLCALGDIMVMQGDRVPELSPELVSLLGSADQILASCEASVGRRTCDSSARYAFMFNMPVEYLRGLLERSGVAPERWALTLANNHAGDAGLEGVGATFRQLTRLGVTALGRWLPDDARPVQVIERKGLRLGLAAWTRWLNVDRFPADGARVWRSADVRAQPWRELRARLGLEALLGLAHWEYEWQHFPHAETRLTARGLHAAGFDLLVGSHPHVLQPVERQGGGLTLYSLGNFCSGLGRAWPARMATVAEIELGTVGEDRGRVVAYRLHPFAQVTTEAGRSELLPLERVPTALRERIQRRLPRLFTGVDPPPGRRRGPQAPHRGDDAGRPMWRGPPRWTAR